MKKRKQLDLDTILHCLNRYREDGALRLIATNCRVAERIRISASQRKLIIVLSDFAVLFEDHEIVKINRTLIKECLGLREALESRRLVTVYASRGTPSAYLIGHHPGSPKLRTGH